MIHAMTIDLFTFLQVRLYYRAGDYGLRPGVPVEGDGAAGWRFTTKMNEALLGKIMVSCRVFEQCGQILYYELQRTGSSVHVRLCAGLGNEGPGAVLRGVFSDEQYPFHPVARKRRQDRGLYTVYERRLVCGEDIGVNGRLELERLAAGELYEFLGRDLKAIESYLRDVLEDDARWGGLVSGAELGLSA